MKKLVVWLCGAMACLAVAPARADNGRNADASISPIAAPSYSSDGVILLVGG
jgi:hypothetical protein